MTGDRPDDPPEPPADPADRRAFAERLAGRADDDPPVITHGEVATAVELRSDSDPETRVAAAGVFQHLYRRSRPSASGLDPEGEGCKPC